VLQCSIENIRSQLNIFEHIITTFITESNIAYKRGSETETVQDIFADIILSPVTQHYNTWTSKILIFLKFGDPNQQMAACGDRATFCFERDWA
jgi:hypothetical protein